MTHFYLNPNFVRQYKNNGQHMEQWTRFTLTGETAKADNLAHDKGADCLGYQIKSARATVCKGTDIRAYLATDMATEYIYAKGVEKAYALDGGQTSSMVFNGELVNRVDWGNERTMSDIIYFASAVPEGGAAK